MPGRGVRAGDRPGPGHGQEKRWPQFAARAHAAGAAGMLSIQLYVEGDSLGALNLFSRRPWAFDDGPSTSG